MASANANLHKAKNAKNDEFYTQLTEHQLYKNVNSLYKEMYKKNIYD